MPGTCTVALKHPHGLVLELYNEVMEAEPLPGGGMRDVKRFRVNHKAGKVILNGWNTRPKKGEPRMPAVGGSFALTHNVDKDFFDEWLKQHADADIVVNKLIFSTPNQNDVTKEAKSLDRQGLKSGLEPLDRANLPKGVSTATV